MNEPMTLPATNGDQRIVAIPGHTGYAVTDDGIFWTCTESKRSTTTSRRKDSEWRELEVSSSSRRSYPWVKMSGTSYNAAQMVLDSFSRERPSSQHVIQYKDGERKNLSLSNLSWVKKDDTRADPPRSRSNKYAAAQNQKWRTRSCLTCHQEFESWGPGNRRCSRCDDKLKSPAYRSTIGEAAKIRI